MNNLVETDVSPGGQKSNNQYIGVHVYKCTRLPARKMASPESFTYRLHCKI